MGSATALGADYTQAPSAEEMDWQNQSLCQGQSELFYSPNAEDIAQAVRFCHQCPVMAACRRHALEKKEVWGVWGGTSETDREFYWKHGRLPVKRKAIYGTRSRRQRDSIFR